ncbi:hypothetical protein HYPSUDRAFT_202589 [Hypholoma sublateritium FD-334 SS-4]|uniref:Uncharacterized protein n=1 Tax=Hypholoma sublateritium (strain FD-334 SS-4) TaxID=945553 RepID=A0A0D2NSP3_HYPSF|nr:hypothetical protein HYPSUDRAFT_202589 [Hypholoma sublateritium FD-334 SS-4]
MARQKLCLRPEKKCDNALAAAKQRGVPWNTRTRRTRTQEDARRGGGSALRDVDIAARRRSRPRRRASSSSSGELAPLLASPALAQSLVLLATHAPPVLPALSHEAPAGPTLRILRLRASLALHVAEAVLDALRHVGVERPKRVMIVDAGVAKQRIGGINEVAEVLVEFVDGSIGWPQACECLRDSVTAAGEGGLSKGTARSGPPPPGHHKRPSAALTAFLYAFKTYA